MGQSKLRLDAAKAGGSHPDGILENPKPIAKRFAYAADLRQAVGRLADAPRASQPAEPRAAEPEIAPPSAGRWLFQTRVLIAGLVLAALAPSLILGALWLGPIGTTGSAPAVPPPETRTLAAAAVLTAPDRIEAVAGEAVGFPVALDGTDGVPSRSVIAIKGLPQGSNFSEGRPYGDSEWTLKPDQIGDLTLVLPAAANGEFKFGIALVAPDDRVIAEAETLLVIAPVLVEPVAAEQSGGVPSLSDGEAAVSAPVPDGSEAATPAAISEGGEASTTAPVSDLGYGDGAEMEEKPAAMEAATTPSVETASGTGEQRVEEATAPSSDTQPNAIGQAKDGESGLGSVEPSVFVNMREGPSSSAPVLGVIAKGTKLSVLDRKRGWVQVTDPATGNQGWIYSGLLAGEAKPDRRIRRVAPAEAEPKSESLWGRLGRWLGPSKQN
jgi:hypothetical protein